MLVCCCFQLLNTVKESRLLVQRLCGCWEMQGRAQARLLLSLDVHTELRYMVFNPLSQVATTTLPHRDTTSSKATSVQQCPFNLVIACAACLLQL
jgi:hypothetical protein